MQICVTSYQSLRACGGVRVGVCARINAILFGDCVRKGYVGGVSGCVSESSLLALKLSAICFSFWVINM